MLECLAGLVLLCARKPSFCGRTTGTQTVIGERHSYGVDDERHKARERHGMSQLFSTDLLPPSDRIDAWQWNAQQICGDCRIRLPKASFHGSIEIRNVAGLPLTRFSSSALSFRKWPSDSANALTRSCLVITQISGSRQYSQAGTEVLLKPGDSTVIDSALPWSSTCETDCVRLYLRVPRWMMANRLRMREIPAAQKITGRTALGATLFRLSQTLYDDAASMETDEVTGALDSYFDALADILGGQQSAGSEAPELRLRVLRFVDAHITEPTLTPFIIAEAMGVSVRHLHRVFSVSGNTLGDYIRLCRLEHCRKDLVDPRLNNRSITEIAFSRGFCDAAHFSHSFRKQYGISARAFRSERANRNRMSGIYEGRFLQGKTLKVADTRLN